MSRAPVRRRRRTAEEARQRILEAAQKRLVEAGPEGLRLQELAADLGISHPAILHHFGSREGLLAALATHGVQGLNAELAGRIRRGAVDLEQILDRTAELLSDGGQARLLAWLALSNRPEPGERPHVLADLAALAHEARRGRLKAEGRRAPPFEDTAFTILLVGLALFGDALVGDLMRESVGVEGPGGSRRFRGWLADLLGAHLSGAPREGTGERPT